MRIKNFDLDDFGCFRRARLQNVDDGLTVIAGPQRAGKTTFMQAVRHLGYGIPRSNGLPPPTDRYELTADVIVDGAEYELALTGYGNPTLTPVNGAPDRTLPEVFGNLGPAQYQQLYTISLDELQRLPTSLDDDASLSAILLGAAYGEVLKIPQIEQRFKDQAKDIGGKHGRAVYNLKGPSNMIQSGVNAREAAMAQVDEHERKQAARDDVDSRIEELDEEITELATEETRLSTVLTEYAEFETLQELNLELEQADLAKVDAFPEDQLDRARQLKNQLVEEQEKLRAAQNEFARQASVENPEAYRDRLLDAMAKIRAYNREITGWRERVQSVQEQQSDFADTRRALRSQALDLQPRWDDESVLDHVREVETDLFSRDTVRSITHSCEELQSEVNEVKRNLAEKTARLEQLEQEIESAPDSSSEGSHTVRDQLPIAAGGTLVALIVGSAVGVVAGAIPGVVVTLLIALVVGAYAASRLEFDSLEVEGVAVETLRADKRSVAADVEGLRSRKADLEADYSTEAEQLDSLREQLGLSDDTSPAAVREFYTDISSLQGDLVTLEGDIEALDEKEEALRSDLGAAAETMSELGYLDANDIDPLEDAKTLFAIVERAESDLALATDVRTAQGAVTGHADELRNLLTEWRDAPDLTNADAATIVRTADQFLERGERVTELGDARAERDEIRRRLLRRLTTPAIEPAFEPYRESDDDDDWALAAFERVLEAHTDSEAIEERLDEIDQATERLEEERGECVERRVELTNELEGLASDEDVREAHATIEAGRRRLEPLVEDYATSRIAKYLLNKLHERFIDRTTGPLLDEASEIFSRITDNNYTAVDSTNEFENLDFESVLANGQTQRTAELSRATTEQLFLAIRLARIRRHESSLPVLLDDSMTNFDPAHHVRTLQAISELADTNQVFLLTCHPEFLERVETHTDSAQYWCLDDGQFDGPYAEPAEPCQLLEPSEL
ncbi:AAA family ATPase [Salinigranum halophilum]|uniref:AAA family ATPase n=1 Tax=Salinigranum halophilum TaxID=2565931 RepID=UPI0010A8A975|nr:AAA family ATPase [Salinigranum halophilum]